MKKLMVLMILMFGLFACSDEDNTEQVEQKEVEEAEEAKKKEEEKKKEADKKAKEKESKREIKVNQTLNTNNLELEVKSATVENEIITIPIWWKQWNMYDKAHLSLIAHPVVEQNGEKLKLVSGDEDLIVQKKQFTPARASLKYELISDKDPVTVRFLDIREEIRDKKITIDLN